MTRHFDRSDRAALPAIIAELGREMVAKSRSVVHVEGTRSLSCREKVQKLSGTFIEMALETGRPIVPVRFVGGLPAQPLPERTELPVGSRSASGATKDGANGPEPRTEPAAWHFVGPPRNGRA